MAYNNWVKHHQAVRVVSATGRNSEAKQMRSSIYAMPMQVFGNAVDPDALFPEATPPQTTIDNTKYFDAPPELLALDPGPGGSEGRVAFGFAGGRAGSGWK